MKHKIETIIILEEDNLPDMVMAVFVSGDVDEAEAIRLGGKDGAYLVDVAQKRWAYVYDDSDKVEWEIGLTGVDRIDNVLRGRENV